MRAGATGAAGLRLHASCVAFDERGVLIRGASGSGKSTLALQLMALGAVLVSDDRTDLAIRDGWPVASAPKALAGLVEARGVGLLAAEALAGARLRVVVDLDEAETERLPPERTAEICGRALPLLRRAEGPGFPAAIRQFALGGRAAR